MCIGLWTLLAVASPQRMQSANPAPASPLLTPFALLSSPLSPMPPPICFFSCLPSAFPLLLHVFPLLSHACLLFPTPSLPSACLLFSLLSPCLTQTGPLLSLLLSLYFPSTCPPPLAPCLSSSCPCPFSICPTASSAACPSASDWKLPASLFQGA